MQQGVLCRFIIYTPQTVHRQGARSKNQNQNYIGLVVKAARRKTTDRVRARANPASLQTTKHAPCQNFSFLHNIF